MTQPDPIKPDPVKKPAKIKKPGRWRRRTLVALITLLVLAIVGRIALIPLLPAVMNKVAKTFKLQIHYDRLDLSLTGGNAAVWGFELVPLEGGDPILRADYLQGDISVAALFRGKLVVYRAAADGVDANFERDANGHIPLLDRFASTATAEPPKSNPTTNPSSPLELEPPLRVDALRLEHVRARVRDLAVTPNIDARMALDFRLSNLGTPGEATRFELDFSSDPILDSLQVEGRATGDTKQLAATLHLHMRGLHLKPAQGYLSAIGLRAVADDISATADGQLNAAVGLNPTDGISGALTFTNARLTADGKESAALDDFSLGIHSLTPGTIKLGKLAINGVRVQTGKNPDGAFAFAGLEIGGPPTASPPQPVAPAPAPPATAAPSAPIRLSLDQMTLAGLHLGFADKSLSPLINLSLDSTGFEIDKLDSEHPDIPATFAISFTAPGVARELRTSGRLSPFADSKSFKLTAAANGITLAAIQPYLNAAGLSSEWKDGKFSAGADGNITISQTGVLAASARLYDLSLTDTSEFLSISKVQLANISLNPQSRTLRAGAIDISGPQVHVARDSTGNLHFLGFKTIPRPVTPVMHSVAAAPAPAPDPAPAAPLPFDNIELDHFAWKAVSLSVKDQAVSPPASLSISDAGFSIDQLFIHLKKSADHPTPGKIAAWLVAPDLASRMEFDGTLTPSFDKTNCDFQVRAAGLHADALATYLRPMGIEPTLHDGTFQLNGNANLDLTAQTPKISLAVDHLNYADQGTSLASVGALQVNGITATPQKISVDSITVNSPHARVLRRPDGGVETMGLHFIPKTPAPNRSSPAPAPAITAAPPTTQPTPSAFAATVGSLAVNAAAVDWIDQAVQPGVSTTLHAQTQIDHFEFSDHPSPAQLAALVSVDGSMDSMKVAGSLIVSPIHRGMRLNFDATGIRAGQLSAYLPATIHSKLHDGQIHLAVAADVSQNPQGGQAIELGLHDFSYSDENVSPFLKFDSFHLKAPRLDPDAKIVSVDDITLIGLETSAQKTETGMDLLGLELASAPVPQSVPSLNAHGAAVSLTSDSQELTQKPPPALATSQASNQDILRQIAADRGKFPLVTLSSLNLNARKISVEDTTHPGAAPVVLSNLQLKNTKPLALLGRDPESNPLAEFQLTGKVDPAVEQFAVNLKAAPFLRQKTLAVDVDVSGIHGSGLTEIAPQLASQIDGHSMTDGRFHTSLQAALKLQTTLPTDFDFSHGGKLDFSLTKTQFRAAPDGPVLAGVAEIRSDAISIAPNLTSVEFKELEIDNLVARAGRDADGIHALGLTIKLPTTRPQAAAQANPPMPAASPHIPENDSIVAAPPSMATNKPPPSPSMPIKIDRLLISGIDCRIEDHTCDPQVIIPINGLDVEVTHITTAPGPDDQPMRFNVLASADKVPLPGRQGSADASRELFSQVAGSGELSLYPQPKGWAKLSLSGFELLGIRGLAHEEKITVGGGTFDSDIDLRFDGAGNIDTSNRLVLTDLSLSEPPNGFISHTLKLPASLDVVIAALQDQDGSITIPLNISIHQGQLSTGPVLAAGVGALGEIIATALASAPLKLAGLLVGSKQAAAEPPVQIAFPAGFSDITPDQSAYLQALADHLRKDDSLRVTLKSDAGRDDVWLAGRRVNPGVENATVLAAAFERRRQALLAARLDAASQVRALLASTDTPDAASALQRLRTIDRELAFTENELDHAYDLLRPGADRQALRRTRAATLAIARARIDSIRQFLMAAGKNKIDPSRISQSNPQFVESPDNQTGSVTATLVKGK